MKFPKHVKPLIDMISRREIGDYVFGEEVKDASYPGGVRYVFDSEIALIWISGIDGAVYDHGTVAPIYIKIIHKDDQPDSRYVGSESDYIKWWGRVGFVSHAAEFQGSDQRIVISASLQIAIDSTLTGIRDQRGAIDSRAVVNNTPGNIIGQHVYYDLGMRLRPITAKNIFLTSADYLMWTAKRLQFNSGQSV